MSGRGKGRGSGPSMPIPASSMAFSRKDVLSSHLHMPPDLYPQAFFKPQPLNKTESELEKTHFQAQILKHLRGSRFYLQPTAKQTNIERYSDKYEILTRQKDQERSAVKDQWDYRLFPDELKPKLKVKRKTNIANLTNNFDEIRKKLENMKEKEDEEKEDEEKEDGGDEVDVFQEEEVEEENDYAMSYFDNGEDYLNDSDDNIDQEATF